LKQDIVLKLKNIKKSFGTNKVLRGLSIDVHGSEVITIIGSSGSGKSTLLRCAALLEMCDEGEIILEGELLIDASKKHNNIYEKDIVRKRANFGFVFQEFNLFPHKNVLQNVTEGPIIVKKMPENQANKLGLEMLDIVGLSDKYDAMPVKLSGGQKQRVAIARALAMKPKVLFFDEPTSALDPELVSEVLDVTVELARQGTTMVIVTHEMGFAYEIADRIIYLNEGIIGEEGVTKSILVEPKTMALKSFLKRFHYSSQLFTKN